MTRRELIAGTAAALSVRKARAAGPSRAAVERYLARIKEVDQAGPTLRSVIEVNPDAVSIAEELDAGPSRGPLHGATILIKDNIDTADRMKTTAGSLALAGAPTPAQDAPLVQRLRSAGAVILGKTNLSEWANFRSTHSVSGWSGRGLQTRNPYALDRNPSGSSSGSAVAVAAELCGMAVGTETDGSVVSPASVNGIVGIKPTVRLIPGAGIVPIAHSQDTAGPMARTVRDAALLLTVLGTRNEDYSTACRRGALKGARLGISRKYFERQAGINGMLDGWVADLKTLGAEVVDPADLPTHGQWSDAEFDVLLYEFKADLNAYLERRRAPVGSLRKLLEFNASHAREEMPWFGQEIVELAEKKGPLTDNAYVEARAKCLRLTREEGIDAVLRKHTLDALVAPTNGPAWLIDRVNGDYDTGGCSSPAAIAGYPHVTVPGGYFRGLPIGLSFFGTAWTEAKLIGYAFDFEQAANARKAPTFPVTLGLNG